MLTRRHLISHRYLQQSRDVYISELVLTPLGEGPVRHLQGEYGGGMACRSSEHVWSVHGDERLHVLNESTLEVATFDLLPNKVVQAAHADLQRRMVAAATWRLVGLFELEADSRARRRTHIRLGDEFGDVRWVRFGGSRLAAFGDRASSGLFDRSRRRELLVWELGEATGPGRPIRLSLPAEGLADMTCDGRYLAVALPDGRIELHDLELFTSVVLDGHDERISLVRFVDDDRLLVSADASGKVVLRTRTADGYATSIAEVSLPRGEIEVTESITEPSRPA